MRRNKILTFTLLSLMTISGCNKNTSSSSVTNSSSSSKIESTSSSSSSFKGYVDLSDAFSNTKYYALRFSNSESKDYHEIYLENMFYFDMNRIGFVELEDDQDYLHSFTTINTSDDYIAREMVVYGRSAGLDYMKDLEEKTIMYLIAQSFNFFVKENENTYTCTDYNFINNVSEHFQTKMYKYASKIEITVGKDDRLEYFRIIEDSYPLAELQFADVEYKELEMYKKWVANGSVIDERIYDYKTIYEDNGDYISIYEGAEVEFEATVNAKDVDGNIYVANRDDNVGHIGIKVVTSDDVSNINIKDIVKVKGVIRTKDLNTYLNNAKVVDTGNDAKYAPIFDEDVLVDSMGGGAYAAGLFATYPQFGDSLYSTYAYVNNMTTDLESDIKVDLACPNQVVGDSFYHMEITIPKEINTEKKQELFNELQKAGKYGEENAYELSLQKFLIKYDTSYAYRIRLEATEDSYIERRPTLDEKIVNNFGLNDFPLPVAGSAFSFYFGGFTNRFLETEYGYSEGEKEGLFISFAEITQENLNTFFLELDSYGAIKYDEVKDMYNQRHILYQKNGINIDILFNEETFAEELTSLQMWMYDGNIITPTTIEEKLNEMIGSWFNVDNFLKLSNTYNADYTIFQLREYAGKFYSEDNPLYCVTLDTDSNVFDDYNKALIDMGYKSYRVNNRPYTYTSRGQSHYVYEKDGVYVDVAIYPTSDYTYTGHSRFEYRLEILIYTGEVMSVETYDDLSVLSNLYAEIDPSLGYYPELPEDCVVEVWRSLHNYKIAPVEYGYGYRDEAFVYTEYVDEAYEACKEAIYEAGFTLTGERTKSALFSKTIDGNLYNILLLKEPEKGYLRVMNDIGGVDFFI